MKIIGANPDGTLVCEVTRKELRSVTAQHCWFAIKLLEPGDEISLASIAEQTMDPLVTKLPMTLDDAADMQGSTL